MSAIPKHRYSLEQYIELDKNSAERYEYFDGVIVDMAGGSLNHNRITRNIIHSLENTREGSGCNDLLGLKSRSFLTSRWLRVQAPLQAPRLWQCSKRRSHPHPQHSHSVDRQI